MKEMIGAMGEMVRAVIFDRKMMEEMISTIPRSFNQKYYARNDSDEC
jgi:hypothetical protein